MTATVDGLLRWGVKRDRDGHRDYTAVWQVLTTDPEDGPAIILNASGLPAIGSYWDLGNDSDTWALCTPEMTARPVVDRKKNITWELEQTFSTRPLNRCQDDSIEDPLLEPYELSGSFVTYRRAMTEDINGPLRSSSWEPLIGPETERDVSNLCVNFAQNYASLSSTVFGTYAGYMHAVNDSTLWGQAARCVKVSGGEFTRKIYGTCSYYYNVRMKFDINPNTHDVTIPDRGTRVLMPGGNPANPAHYKYYQDKAGGCGLIFLDGAGSMWDGTGSPGLRLVQHYAEEDLLLLGIPSTI